MQRGYACFDAYARISLTVSAQQLLLVPVRGEREGVSAPKEGRRVGGRGAGTSAGSTKIPGRTAQERL